MKNALITALAIFAVSAMIFGITEKQGKDVYRQENVRLREEVKKITRQATNARLQAEKFKQIAETERKACEEMIKVSSQKKK
jgi:type II secretory pathway component PulK